MNYASAFMFFLAGYVSASCAMMSWAIWKEERKHYDWWENKADVVFPIAVGAVISTTLVIAGIFLS